MIRCHVFALALLALLVACAPADPFEVNPGCASICEQTAACYAAGEEAEDLCFRQCAGAAAGAGSLAQDVVDGCAACLQGVDCGGLVAGECAARCPHGVFGGVSTADSGAPQPREDASTPPAERCDGRWLEEGTSYEIYCERPTADAFHFDCDCYRDGLRESSFRSSDVCELDDDTRAERAAAGCDWVLAE
ncbi:MAG: hypothetical protein M5U28_29115 [Sandaracinaceae bacterium]|nr:hypothetical protein [Sandaracinaceae bacterium]